jgi:glutathione peroxidase-family protein
MKILKYASMLVLFTLAVFASDAKVGEAAPNFTLTDSNGNEHSLSDFNGKYVVLEWINYDCPFVKKHYDSGNMQMLQKKYTEKGVVWLAINSSAEGKQGNFSNEEINSRSKEHNANFTAYLVDSSGEVGKMYGAKTTPHMYVISPEGSLIYAGGIDDIPSTDIDDIETANNYVSAALDASMNGKDVAVKVSQPYGCSVKY